MEFDIDRITQLVLALTALATVIILGPVRRPFWPSMRWIRPWRGCAAGVSAE